MGGVLIGVAVVLVAAAVGGVVVGRRAAVARDAAFAGPKRVLTSPDGPATGPLAQALACGAHLAVFNERPWNLLHDPDAVAEDVAADLRVVWGVTSSQEWQQTADWLLDPDTVDEHVLALDVRRQMLEHTGAPPDEAAWRRALAAVGRDSGWKQRLINQVALVARRTLRFEDRLRRDGLLADGAVVASTRAFDYGRVPTFVMWGLAAGYCDDEQARATVLRAGTCAGRAYPSWEAFSVAYTLGRALWFDHGRPGRYHTSSVDTHRALMEAGDSPWRTLPWPVVTAGADARPRG